MSRSWSPSSRFPWYTRLVRRLWPYVPRKRYITLFCKLTTQELKYRYAVDDLEGKLQLSEFEKIQMQEELAYWLQRSPNSKNVLDKVLHLMSLRGQTVQHWQAFSDVSCKIEDGVKVEDQPLRIRTAAVRRIGAEAFLALSEECPPEVIAAQLAHQVKAEVLREYRKQSLLVRRQNATAPNPAG